jgi:glycerophosphoryl diester phosphodiesterase
MRSSPSALPDRLLAPPPAAKRVAFLSAQPFAHRGLHGVGRVENSRAAFVAAIAEGHGIECDVQVSRDAEIFVFHDYELDRLTGSSGPVAARPAASLAAIPLKGTTETLPRLDEMLALVAGRVSLLIEVKAKDRHVGGLCLAVRRALEGYRGAVAVMSFNPQVPRWFALHAPKIVRGLVVTEEGKRDLRGRFERHLSLWRARPDFLAYDIRDLPSRFAAAQRSRGMPVLTWTVRGAAAEATAHAHADQIIYEKPAP